MREQQFLTAIINNDIDIFNSLIEESEIDFKDDNGWTPLLWATNYGNEKFVASLIKKGANLNIQNNNDMTALMIASRNNSTEIVTQLINSGANITIKSNFSQTAYQMAKELDLVKVMFLINPQIINVYDNDLLMTYCKIKHEESVLFMYDKGADFYFENNHGESALSILDNHEYLPDKLQALKERLILNMDSIENDILPGLSL